MSSEDINTDSDHVVSIEDRTAAVDFKEKLRMKEPTGHGAQLNRAFPPRRQDVLKWNGWGYADSKFQPINNDESITFTGARYPALSGEMLPYLLPWFQDHGGDVKQKSCSRAELNIADYPEAYIVKEFVQDIEGCCRFMSLDVEDRVFHGHGHTVAEVFALRHGKLDRIPDFVVWPTCHDDVEQIVKAAVKHNVCLIPFGGGTSVTLALQCPKDEKRMIVSVDTTEMNEILWIDQENLLARIQSGIIGQDLEKRLKGHGFCTGHEPDSMEFSSLGGWVATRASGMKKNVYGNIEDLVVSFKVVTPSGTIEKSAQVPRISAGPDIYHCLMGSEGTLGIVTEVTMKIRPVPEYQTYGSVVFPDFECGIAFLREIARRKCAPASVRLMDNDQFQFGQALKLGSTSLWTNIVDSIKKFYLIKFKQFDPRKMCVCTLLFEGAKEVVEASQKMIYAIVPKYGGIPAGPKNGERGYKLTFVIAYLRDLGMDHSYIGESFETSVPWDKVGQLCRNVKALLAKKCHEYGRNKNLITCRVTQTYDSGACVYFYFGFGIQGLHDPVHTYEEIESCARDEILANGGSISHHHGVGQIRKKWLEKAISPLGVDMLQAVKKTIDPTNIFSVKNLL